MNPAWFEQNGIEEYRRSMKDKAYYNWPGLRPAPIAFSSFSNHSIQGSMPQLHRDRLQIFIDYQRLVPRFAKFVLVTSTLSERFPLRPEMRSSCTSGFAMVMDSRIHHGLPVSRWVPRITMGSQVHDGNLETWKSGDLEIWKL